MKRRSRQRRLRNSRRLAGEYDDRRGERRGNKSLGLDGTAHELPPVCDEYWLLFWAAGVSPALGRRAGRTPAVPAIASMSRDHWQPVSKDDKLTISGATIKNDPSRGRPYR